MRTAGFLLAWIALGCASVSAAATEAAAVEAKKPCAAAEYRQFDFWLGVWDVPSAAASGRVSRNRITAINDGCTLREEYTTPDGYAGTSVNFYDAARKRWHQTWVDNQGGALYLEGGIEGEAMVMRTVDGGKSWTTVFDGRYTRSSQDQT